MGAATTGSPCPRASGNCDRPLSARCRGLGRALIRAAVEGARTRSCRAVALQVSTAKRAALALYAVESFRRMRKLPGFYRRLFGDGGDAWVMVLPLGAAEQDGR